MRGAPSLKKIKNAPEQTNRENSKGLRLATAARSIFVANGNEPFVISLCTNSLQNDFIMVNHPVDSSNFPLFHMIIKVVTSNLESVILKSYLTFFVHTLRAGCGDWCVHTLLTAHAQLTQVPRFFQHRACH